MLARGSIISNDYEVVRSLASGGMGSVYVVRQLSTNATRVLKVMQPALEGDPDAQRRFEREARIGAQIQSDHIVEVLAAGEHDSLRWIVMPQLEGLTLGAAMQRWGPPGSADGDRVLEQLFHAIAAAHDANVVHRDLKPENIFLAQLRTRSGGFSLKVLDFGIAKWLGSGSATGMLGTWTWAAPEQSLKEEAIGCYTDVWALGLLVFWLLTGREFWLPVLGHAALLGQVHLAHIPKPSERAAELGCSCQLSAEFDLWFARCVARDPRERFEHASAAYRALAQLQLTWNPYATAWNVGAGSEVPSETASAYDSTVASQTGEGVSPMTAAASAGRSSQLPAKKRSISRKIASGTALVPLLLAGGFWLQRARQSTRAPAIDASRQAQSQTPAGMVRVAASLNGAAVKQASFWLDRNEVSVEEYQGCVRANQCTPAALTEAGDDSAEFAAMCNSSSETRAKQPINCVSWYQAQAFCKFASKRLPTEREWRWAAEGAEHRSYPWGNSLPQTCEDAVVSGLCTRKPTATREVGTRKSAAASPDGVFDLSGNVWEWVAEGEVPSDALAALRGGGWDYPREQAMSASRVLRSKQFADVSTGFRCAL